MTRVWGVEIKTAVVSLVAILMVAYSVALMVRGIDFPGRYKVTTAYGGQVLFKTDTWSGRTWIADLSVVSRGDPRWRPVTH